VREKDYQENKIMKSAKVTTKSGHSWTTSINGTYQSIVKYFMGKRFDVGVYPQEKMEQVVSVEVFDHDGTPEIVLPHIARLHYKPTGSITYGVMYDQGVYKTFRYLFNAKNCLDNTPIHLVQLYALSHSGLTFLNSDYEITVID